MSEGRVLYYLLAVFCGVAVSLIYLFWDRRGKSKPEVKTADMQKKIRAYILPNNQGRPIDEVVARMQIWNGRLKFSVDVFGGGDEVGS